MNLDEIDADELERARGAASCIGVAGNHLIFVEALAVENRTDARDSRQPQQYQLRSRLKPAPVSTSVLRLRQRRTVRDRSMRARPRLRSTAGELRRRWSSRTGLCPNAR